MAVQTAAGARFYIGPVAASTVDTQNEFEALSYTAVGEIEDMGELADAWGAATFVAMSDSRVRRFKTTKDGGTPTLTIGFDSGDAGQTALVAAFASKSEYAFKITLDDASSGSPSGPTTWYFRGKVMSNSIAIGNNENIVRRNVQLTIDSDRIEVAAV